MAALKLTYFDTPSSRGEECRLALFLAGLPFDDDRVNGEKWAAFKDKSPFGALPVLTVEGKGMLAQTNAILRYVGAAHGLLPADPWEAAQHEAVMGAVEDLRTRIGQTTRIKDADERKKAREELAAGYMKEWAGNVEKQIGVGPFFGGSSISTADIKLFVVMTPIVKGAMDHIATDEFASFPKLTRLYEAVKNHPRVVAWYARK